MTAIENRSGRSITRLESFRDALEQVVTDAGDLSRQNSSREVLPLLKLFAYGFGVGGMLSALFRNRGPDVRDLLELPGGARQPSHSIGLLGFLRGLEREGFDFSHDERLIADDAWDADIRQSIDDSDIALVLVSQSFLNSAYCRDVEIAAFLDRRQRDGLIIFPVIISPCDWRSHPWLASTQFEPRNGQTIETHYKDRGSRHQLYLTVLEQLRTIAARIQLGHSA